MARWTVMCLWLAGAITASLPSMPAFAAGHGYILVSLVAQSERSTADSGIGAIDAPAEEMRNAIVDAALSGSFEALLAVVELNELPPDFGPGIATPAGAVEAWQRHDPAFSGRLVLARLAAVLALPPAERTENSARVYVFPYLVDVDLQSASGEDIVALLQVASPNEAGTMLAAGRYTGWQVAISEDGVWLSFTPPNGD
ncbi:MAG: hypothetical protein GC150_02095 [Rhizobiales bacterium]|nr:hypothetical protein [Hyphomicrobiales bacterium]